jgi:hypothetical protein
MKRSPLPVLFLLFTSLCGTAWGASQTPVSFGVQSSPTSYDPVSFGAELHRLDVLLRDKPSGAKISDLRKSLPPAWSIYTPEQTYTVSTEPLRTQLDARSADKAATWVGLLQGEIKASQANTLGSVAAHRELDHILAGPEFAGVRPPGALQLLRARILAWLEKMFLKLFKVMGQHPMGAEILFWLLLIGGVAFVALWMFRFLSGRGSMARLTAKSSPVTRRTWQEWLRNAREAASGSDFREAVHSAYWAGITRLEDSGAVPRDRTKTPREYLRIVTTPRSEQSQSVGNIREPLTVLTLSMERTWYANRIAVPEDFSDSLRQLEALGCPLD